MSEIPVPGELDESLESAGYTAYQELKEVIRRLHWDDQMTMLTLLVAEVAGIRENLSHQDRKLLVERVGNLVLVTKAEVGEKKTS